MAKSYLYPTEKSLRRTTLKGTITDAIKVLDSLVKHPEEGLPDELFLFVSRIAPMVNVDLLIKENGRILLTWRDDKYAGRGWHVPGRMNRYHRPIADCIRACAQYELGAKIRFDRIPLTYNEIILPKQRNRSHFIALLFNCSLVTPPIDDLKYRGGSPKVGQWMWHKGCPKDLIKLQSMYKEYIR